jgi:hypothetical protein
MDCDVYCGRVYISLLPADSAKGADSAMSLSAVQKLRTSGEDAGENIMAATSACRPAK